MKTMDAIYDRRSIRKWQDRPVPRELIEQVLEATIQAPSAKNGQPWRFVVLEGQRKQALVDLMLAQADLFESKGWDIGSLRWTARSMALAPVTIMVFNTAPPPEVPAEAHPDWNFVMLQSTGGAIQTMLLAAEDLGLGSLWICDVLYARCEINTMLRHPDDTLVAAVSLGYADETPNPRPRKPWPEVTEWLED